MLASLCALIVWRANIRRMLVLWGAQNANLASSHHHAEPRRRVRASNALQTPTHMLMELSFPLHAHRVQWEKELLQAVIWSRIAHLIPPLLQRQMYCHLW